MNSLRGKRIFYVEDNPGNRCIVQTILESHGAKIVCYRWGDSAAVEKIKAALPLDLILCDLMLPDNCTGYDVFAAVRRDPALHAVPVAMLSAVDPTLELNKARALGFAGFIGKPIHLLRFPAQVSRMIGGAQVWESD